MPAQTRRRPSGALLALAAGCARAVTPSDAAAPDARDSAPCCVDTDAEVHGSIHCNDATCPAATQLCCLTYTAPGAICHDRTFGCGSGSIECDGPAACPAGLVCCVDLVADRLPGTLDSPVACATPELCAAVGARFVGCFTDGECPADSPHCRAWVGTLSRCEP